MRGGSNCEEKKIQTKEHTITVRGPEKVTKNPNINYLYFNNKNISYVYKYAYIVYLKFSNLD